MPCRWQWLPQRERLRCVLRTLLQCLMVLAASTALELDLCVLGSGPVPGNDHVFFVY